MAIVLAQTLVARGELSKQVAEEISSAETEFDLDMVFAQVTAFFPGLVSTRRLQQNYKQLQQNTSF